MALKISPGLLLLGGAGLLIVAAGGAKAVKGPSGPPPKPLPPGTGDKGANLPDSFWKAFIAMSDRLGADPVDLATILYNESGGFNPHAVNSILCAGLNQLCPGPGTFGSIVENMSLAQWNALSSEEKVNRIHAYAAKSAEQQLPYVEKYFKQKPAASMKSARDIYWVNFLPATYKAGTDDSFVLTRSPAAAYTQNAGFDTDKPKKGYITTGDLRKFTDGIRAEKGFQPILQRINQNRAVA